MMRDTIVIGAGVVGISIALELQRRGFEVTIVDRKGIAAEASKGNAGAFAFSEIIPLATPGIIRKATGWLLDPMGPLSVPPSYALKLAPWMIRFWRASWAGRYLASVEAQSQLMAFSKIALERQIVSVDGEDLIMRDGQLQLFEGAKEFSASAAAWQLRRKHGVKFEELKSVEAIAEIQPGLNSKFSHGIFTPDWMNTVDPYIWTKHLADKFSDNGGQIEQAEICEIAPTEDGVQLECVGEPIVASRVVVAAGAWSHHLARTIGDQIPLETERGYNTTLPQGAFDLRTQLTFGGHGFVVSKISGGVRIGGAVELGGLNLPPNYKRADFLLNKAKNFMPELRVEGGKKWMGFRPSLPDSLPVFGKSSRNKNVFYAFGHGHLGLTQAAGTAELIAALVSGEAPALPLDPYSPNRF